MLKVCRSAGQPEKFILHAAISQNSKTNTTHATQFECIRRRIAHTGCSLLGEFKHRLSIIWSNLELAVKVQRGCYCLRRIINSPAQTALIAVLRTSVPLTSCLLWLGFDYDTKSLFCANLQQTCKLLQKWVALLTIHEHKSNQTLLPMVSEEEERLCRILFFFLTLLDGQYLPPSVFVALNGTL